MGGRAVKLTRQQARELVAARTPCLSRGGAKSEAREDALGGPIDQGDDAEAGGAAFTGGSRPGYATRRLEHAEECSICHQWSRDFFRCIDRPGGQWRYEDCSEPRRGRK